LLELFLQHVLLKELQTSFQPVITRFYTANKAILFIESLGFLQCFQEFIAQPSSIAHLYHTAHLLNKFSAFSPCGKLHALFRDR